MAIGSDRPGARVLEGALEAGWISVRAVGETGATQDIFMLLGQGEAEAIALAEQRQARLLLIDDARGRRIARSRGVRVTGVADVLLAAKNQREVEAVAPLLRALSDAGYRLAPPFVAKVLVAAGEE